MTADERAELRDLARVEAAKAPPLTVEQVAELRDIFARNGDGPRGGGPSESSTVAAGEGARGG